MVITESKMTKEDCDRINKELTRVRNEQGITLDHLIPLPMDPEWMGLTDDMPKDSFGLLPLAKESKWPVAEKGWKEVYKDCPTEYPPFIEDRPLILWLRGQLK